MAYQRNPSTDTSLGGCQPLRSYKRREHAEALGSEPYLCSCGYWHRRYVPLPEDAAEQQREAAEFGVAPKGKRAPTLAVNMLELARGEALSLMERNMRVKQGTMSGGKRWRGGSR